MSYQKSQLCLQLAYVASCDWWKSVLTWTNHHLSTNHISLHGRVVRVKEISHSAREYEATGSITSCSYFLFFAPTLRLPLFQLSSSLRFSPLLACPPIFSISLYLYLHSHMWLRPKSSLLKPTWPKTNVAQK